MEMERYCPPPSRFRQAGNVRRARLSSEPPPFLNGTPRATGARAEGRRYERKAIRHFGEVFDYRFIPQPWIQYWDESGDHWCQPDGLLFNVREGTIAIVEFKLKHTSDAWWQLARRYLPVVSTIFPSGIWRTSCVEVVRWFDPNSDFPVRPVLRRSLNDLRPDKINVHIWNDKLA